MKTESIAQAVLALQQGQFEHAVELLQRAIQLSPPDPVPFNYLGLAFSGSARWDEAERSFRQALSLNPDYAEALYNLANALASHGNLHEAERNYRQALALRPDFVEAHGNLGNVLAALGRVEEAAICYRQALALNPGLALAHNNLGNALLSLGRPEEAERSFRAALEGQPEYAEAYNNLGNTLALLQRPEEAEQSYRQALLLKPLLAEAHYHLGLVLAAMGRTEEAEQRFRQALASRPGYADAHYDLGNLVGGLGRLEEAALHYRRALAERADYPEALGQWVHKSQWLCAWWELGQPISQMHDHVAHAGSGRLWPFCFLALPDSSAAEQLLCARQFAQHAFRSQFTRKPRHGGERPARSTRLRVGYLSADFHEHATSYLLAEVIEQHDRSRFEVIGYSYGPEDKSPMRTRMRCAFETFRDIRNASSEAAAQRIAADEIDVLLELKGYTGSSRPEIAALRPAPVQASWLGYPGTLGHRRLADYLIGDTIVTPLEHAAHYSETLALMPHCYQPNDRQRIIGPRPSRAAAGLPESAFVFCSFCQPYKITPLMFDLWCRLLRSVAGSRLWLLDTTATARENLAREAAARGVGVDRLLYAPRLPLAEHLGRLQLADLALDTYPYTSHTTASDALWTGVPLVTLMGETFASRVAASLLHAAGLPELVTRNAESYYDLALDLATRPARLAALRARLLAGRLESPLFDSERFTRDLERLLERIWLNYRSGKNDHVTI